MKSLLLRLFSGSCIVVASIFLLKVVPPLAPFRGILVFLLVALILLAAGTLWWWEELMSKSGMLRFPEGMTPSVGLWLILLAALSLFGLHQLLAPQDALPLFRCSRPGAGGSVGCEASLQLGIAAFGGLFGAVSYAIERYIEHAIKSCDFEARYTAWYVARPLQGAVLAVIFYLLLRGGVLALGVSDEGRQFNAFTLASVCALVGLFSNDAAQRLRVVFQALFATKPPTDRDARERLRELKALLDQRILTEQEYQVSRTEILKRMQTW